MSAFCRMAVAVVVLLGLAGLALAEDEAPDKQDRPAPSLFDKKSQQELNEGTPVESN